MRGTQYFCATGCTAATFAVPTVPSMKSTLSDCMSSCAAMAVLSGANWSSLSVSENLMGSPDVALRSAIAAFSPTPSRASAGATGPVRASVVPTLTVPVNGLVMSVGHFDRSMPISFAAFCAALSPPEPPLLDGAEVFLSPPPPSDGELHAAVSPRTTVARVATTTLVFTAFLCSVMWFGTDQMRYGALDWTDGTMPSVAWSTPSRGRVGAAVRSAGAASSLVCSSTGDLAFGFPRVGVRG